MKDIKKKSREILLVECARDGQWPIVWKLCEDGVDPNGANLFGQTAAHYAARDGNLEMLRELAKSSNMDSACGAGRTPLMEASRSSRPECVRFLLTSAGAKRVDRDGASPLIFALGNNGPDSAECCRLLAPESDWDAKTWHGRRSALQACEEYVAMGMLGALAAMAWRRAYQKARFEAVGFASVVQGSASTQRPASARI